MPIGTASKMSTGQFREFAGAVLRSLPDDLDPTTVQGWIENQEALRKALREALSSSKPTRNVYPVAVDYGKSVEEMVELGRYDWSNDAITSNNFPTERSGREKIQIELVHFSWYGGTDEVLKELNGMGLRPAELRELLAFGEKYPEVQREFPIIALGSVWRSPGGRRVPYLGGSSSVRRLGLRWVEIDWEEIYRFAAVCK